jgi:hypothetical protein
VADIFNDELPALPKNLAKNIRIGVIGEKAVQLAFKKMCYDVQVHKTWESGVDFYAVKDNLVIVGQIWNWAQYSYCNPKRWKTTLNELLAYPDAFKFVFHNGNLTRDQIADCTNLHIIMINIGFQILEIEEGVIQYIIECVSRNPSCVDVYNISYDTVNCGHPQCETSRVSEVNVQICTMRRGIVSKKLVLMWFYLNIIKIFNVDRVFGLKPWNPYWKPNYRYIRENLL